MSEASDTTFDAEWNTCSCGVNQKHAEDEFCADCQAMHHALEKND